MRIALVNDVVTALEAMRRVIAQHTRTSDRLDRARWRRGARALRSRHAGPHPDGSDHAQNGRGRSHAPHHGPYPCAIVVVTANVNDRSAKVFEAMGVGALDAVNTPVLERPGGHGVAGALLAKIETIHKLIGSGRRKQPLGVADAAGAASRPAPLPVDWHRRLGGRANALAKVLAPLPADLPAAVVIVQHVDAQFARRPRELAEAAKPPCDVRLAREGDRPETGTALVAGGDSHLVFTGATRLAYTCSPVNCAYRPSIDLFFNSANRFWSGDVIGVLLSGMGRDGAEGLRALHTRGHHTIAQDRSSSAAYGMPGAAAELHAASEILPLEKIGPRLKNLVAQRARANA